MTAVQEFTEVFRTGHRQVRDLLLELAGAFGDRDAGWASFISGCVSGWATSAWPGARPGDRRQGFVFISHLGTVHPSGFLPLAAGSVRAARLAGIYRTSPLLRDHGMLAGWCGACEFACVCGGSRSRAFALSGDPYTEDPWCSCQPGPFPYPDDLAAAGLRPAAGSR